MAKRGSKWAPGDADLAFVKAAAGCGLSHAQIAKNLPSGKVAPATLAKYCAEELETGEFTANFRVLHKLWQLAIGGNIAAIIWWTKNRCTWHEPLKTLQLQGDADRPLLPPQLVIQFVDPPSSDPPPRPSSPPAVLH